MLAEKLNPMELSNPSLARYVIDAEASRFTVRAFATGFLSVFGHNPTIGIHSFEGEVRLAEDSLDGAGLHLEISAASLAVQDQVSDKDSKEIERLMRNEVLEISRFPQITYECSRVSGKQTGRGQYKVTLQGELALHGTTRPEPVDAYVNILGSMLRASGECILRQTDYGIKLVSAVAGTLRVKDEVKLFFDLSARKQDGSNKIEAVE